MFVAGGVAGVAVGRVLMAETGKFAVVCFDGIAVVAFAGSVMVGRVAVDVAFVVVAAVASVAMSV